MAFVTPAPVLRAAPEPRPNFRIHLVFASFRGDSLTSNDLPRASPFFSIYLCPVVRILSIFPAHLEENPLGFLHLTLLRGIVRRDVLREFYTKNVGKEEETGGDRQKEGGGPRPPRRGFQSQEGEEGFHDP